MQNHLPQTLKTGDRVTFGVFESKFRYGFVYLIFVVKDLLLHERQMNREKERLGDPAFTPKLPQQPEVGQSEARNQEPLLSLPHS